MQRHKNSIIMKTKADLPVDVPEEQFGTKRPKNATKFTLKVLADTSKLSRLFPVQIC